MILQSKFHDYYDSVLGQFRDEKIVYQRATRPYRSVYEKRDGRHGSDDLCSPELVELSTKYVCTVQETFSGSVRDNEPILTAVYAIVFCGKVYPFSVNVYPGSPQGGGRVVRDYNDPYGVLPKTDYLWRFKKQRDIDYRGGMGISSLEAEKVNKELAPIILLQNARLQPAAILNPALSEYGFPMHAFDVAQNLMQFLAPKEPEMVEVANQYKVIAKGFNTYSFRRDPGGPTRKRKREKGVGNAAA